MSLSSGMAVAEPQGGTPIAEMDDHYAIASEHFGQGRVQIHSRQAGAEGDTHRVHEIDCIEQTFKTVFEGDAAPDRFPVAAQPDAMERLRRESGQLPIARHVCDQHGFPIAELRW